MKKTFATVRIKAENHDLNFTIDITAKETLLGKLQLISETISFNDYLSDGSNRLESIYFFESEEIL